MTTELSKSEKRDGLIYGAVAGVLSVALSIVALYYTRSADSYSSLFMVSTLLKIVGSIVIPVAFVYLLSRKYGALWSFSHALKSIYIFLACSIIVGSLGITLFQKNMDKMVVEESYHNLMNLKIIDMEGKGASEEEIDEQLEVIELDKEFALSDFSFRNTVAPIFISLLMNFLFALILALLFRTSASPKTINN